MKKFAMAAIMLAMILSACGNTENSGSPVQTTQALQEQSKAQATDESLGETTPEATDGYNITWEDMEDIHMLYPSRRWKTQSMKLQKPRSIPTSILIFMRSAATINKWVL